MPKYKVKNAKSHTENSAPKVKYVILEPKECHLKESPLQTEMDSSNYGTLVEPGICSQCQVSGRGLVQCEYCDIWYCDVYVELLKKLWYYLVKLNVFIFCSPCEGEVFKAVDKKIVKTLLPFL